MAYYEYWEKIINEASLEELIEMRQHWVGKGGIMARIGSPVMKDQRIYNLYWDRREQLEKLNINNISAS